MDYNHKNIMKRIYLLALGLLIAFAITPLTAQRKKSKTPEKKEQLPEVIDILLKMRGKVKPSTIN